MRLVDSFKISFSAVRINKLRSGLTALGIIIGIASVIVMISLGQGAQNLIIGQIASMGSRTVFVEPGAFDPKKGGTNFMQMAAQEQQVATLKYEDALALEKDPLVSSAAPLVLGVAEVVYQNSDQTVTFIGSTPAVYNILNISIAEGRGLIDSDIKSMARVAVIGSKLKKDLFGTEDPIGKKIRIKDLPFTVIGVTAEKGSQMLFDVDALITMPVLTAEKQIMGVDHVRQIMVQTKSEAVIDQAVASMRQTLRDRHKINNPENDLSKDDFKITTQKETASMVSTVTSVLTLFLSMIAAIALLVGGIGIMNIMFVSVTERTREIGLRKAVGAKNADILTQFLIEAVILTVLGGIIGILSGIFVSFLGVQVIQQFGGLKGWTFVIPYQTIIYAFFICVLVGIVFGIYPARQAALKNPIEALRYE